MRDLGFLHFLEWNQFLIRNSCHEGAGEGEEGTVGRGEKGKGATNNEQRTRNKEQGTTNKKQGTTNNEGKQQTIERIS